MNAYLLTPYAAALLVSAAVSAAVTILAWNRRNMPGGMPMALLLLAVTAWNLTGALEAMATTLTLKVFWGKIAYFGIASTPVLFLLVGLEYSRQTKLLTRLGSLLLWAFPLYVLALVFTNDLHYLYWSSYTFVESANTVIYGRGSLFWISLALIYSMVMIATFLILWTIFRFPATYRAQSVILFAGSILPWVGSALYLFELTPWRGIDYTPIAFSGTGLLLSYGILRHGLFELVPIARDAVVENMADGVIVTDRLGHIVDINPIARGMLQLPEKIIGEYSETILENYPALLDYMRENAPSAIIELRNNQENYLEARIAPIKDRRGLLGGHIILLHDITNRKQAEEKIRSSETLYRLLAENTTDVIWILDLETMHFAYVSPAVEKLRGYSVEEALTQRIEDSVSPNSMAYLAQELPKRMQLAHQGEALNLSWTDEIEQIHKDGHIIWTEVVSTVVYSAEEKIQILGVSRDITERKRINDEIQRNRAQLKAMLDNAGLGIFLMNPNGQFNFCNDRWANMISEKSAQIAEKNLSAYVHPYDLFIVRTQIQSVADGQADQFNLEARFIQPEGKSFWGQFSASALRGMDNTLEIVGFVSDITERKLAEEALRESERRFRETIENINLIAISLDTQGKITYCNDYMLNLTGWRRGEVLGRSWFETFIQDGSEREQDYIRALQNNSILAHNENRILCKNGEMRAIAWTNIILHDNRGKVIGSTSLGADVTEVRRAQQAESEQRALAEALADTASELSSTLDVNEVLDRILENVGRVVPHDAAHIDATVNGTPFERARGYGAFSPPKTLQLETNHNPDSILHLFENQNSADNSAPNAQTQEKIDWIKARLSAPILLDATQIGVLTLDSATPEFFNAEHAKRLQAFATQAAIALENVRLYQQSLNELAERTRAQAELKRANKRLKNQLEEIEALQVKLREQAIRDPLTGLFNRRYLEETIARELARAERDHTNVSFIFLDIDRFKHFNDEYGHEGGDAMLQSLSGLLLHETRQADIPCRYGGEEFLMVLPGASFEVAQARAERWRQEFEAMSVTYREHTMRATISLGVATYPLHSKDKDEVIRMADMALYEAKNSGRNRVVAASVPASV
jgi:diguanylate cyclase (GGDEF)-like protein/PAS domain S-box-containing protein